jgi:hypothetical protein
MDTALQFASGTLSEERTEILALGEPLPVPPGSISIFHAGVLHQSEQFRSPKTDPILYFGNGVRRDNQADYTATFQSLRSEKWRPDAVGDMISI